MKKIIGIIFISLMFCNIGFGEMRELEEGSVRFETTGKGYVGAWVTTMCIDGYKFVVMRDSHRDGLSVAVTQAFEERDGKLLPAKC